MLVRDRGFTSLAVLSLALGIRVTTSIFSVVERILFRSLPYACSDRLVSVGIAAPMLPHEFVFGAASIASTLLSTKVALLSHGLWQSRFGGRPDVLGRTISLAGQTGIGSIGKASRTARLDPVVAMRHD
jgi:hypothetical protein